MENKVSIIVPIYNAEKYLQECIESIIFQTYKNLEIILINDGSTDKSLEICREFSKKDNRIIVLDKKNSGVSSTRNEGLNLCNGTYVTFVDADDILCLDFIEKLMHAFEQDNCDIVISNYSTIDNEKNIILTQNIKHYENFIDFITYNCIWAPWAKIVKKECLKNVCFDENTYVLEDYYFWYTSNIETFKFLDEPLYLYRKNEESVMNKKIINNRLLSEFIVLEKIIKSSNDYISNYFKMFYINRFYVYSFKYEDYSKLLNHNNNYIMQICKKYYKDLFANNKVQILNKIKLSLKMILLLFKQKGE